MTPSPFPASSFSSCRSSLCFLRPISSGLPLPVADFTGPSQTGLLPSLICILNLIASAKSLWGMKTWTSLGTQCSACHNAQHRATIPTPPTKPLLPPVPTSSERHRHKPVHLRNLLGAPEPALYRIGSQIQSPRSADSVS